MKSRKTARYGEWASAIPASLSAQGSLRLEGLAFDGDDLLWIEGRPGEDGRSVLVRRRANGAIEDLTPAGYDVRSRAHEYGGGAFLAVRGEHWFVNGSDQRLYRHRPGREPEPVTAPGPFRYADFVLDAGRRRLIGVREDHSRDQEPVNELVAVGLDGGAVTVLAGGDDFYSSPALSPDGSRLAWLSWNHPHMPWDQATAWVARLGPDGKLQGARAVAGGDGVSAFQPAWSPAGELYVVADPGGWWNLHRWDGERLRCVLEMEAESGLPQWQFGMRTYGFTRGGSVVAAYCFRGRWRLGRLEPRTGNFFRLAVDLSEIRSLAVSGDQVAVIGASPRQAAAVVVMDLATGSRQVLRHSLATALADGVLSEPEPIEFPTGDGESAHGFFYPPRNPRFQPPEGERPPLLVMSHGGPTAAASPGLNLKLQYWTSRGFAVLDVNYRGSTGYGRRYRDRLKGRWGVADVEDCVRGALYLARTGRVDGARLAIRGGSAGGYTVLAALTFRDLFRAGASYYGIGDLETLARDTHKFEAHYLEQLVGAYPGRRELYRARSPVHAVERVGSPVIFFQGLDDRVVPPSQAERMVAALRAKGVPVAYLPFPGESHGFRKAETIQRALEAELYFYGRVLGFIPADRLAPIRIDNL